MAGTAFVTPSGGLWPLGKITVTTAGTPVRLNINVGTQGQGPLQMARRVRQFIFSQATTTTAGKKIYLMFGNNAKTKTNNIIAVIGAAPAAGAVTDPGPVAIPPIPLIDGCPTPDQYYLDADESGAAVIVTAIYA